MRTEAVALDTPSMNTLALVAWPLLFRLEPILMFCVMASPGYWSTNLSSGTGPSPSTNTGSCCDSTFTSRNTPLASSAISRLTGVPENPGTGAKSTDSNA